MKINLLILKSDDNKNKTKLENQIQGVIGHCVSDTDDNSMSDSINNPGIMIDYDIKMVSDDCADLNIFCEDSLKIETAKELDIVARRVIGNLEQKGLDCIVAYDEVSDFFCKGLMPYFTKYERKLRRIIYITVIKAFGNKWFDMTFARESKDKKKIKIEKSNDALEELDYGNIKQYLFNPISFVDLDSLLETELSKDKIDSLDKDQIIQFINSSRKASLWDRLFGEYLDIVELPELINDLNKPRNKVMHSKRISFNEYDNTKRRLRKINAMLEKTIQYAEGKMYSEMDKMEVSISLHNVYESLSQATSKILESIMPKVDYDRNFSAIYADMFSDIDFKMPFTIDVDYKELPAFQMLKDKSLRYNSIMESLSDTIKKTMPQLNAVLDKIKKTQF